MDSLAFKKKKLPTSEIKWLFLYTERLSVNTPDLWTYGFYTANFIHVIFYSAFISILG